MKFSQPAQTKHTTTWEGGSVPPLRLTGQKASVLSGTQAPEESVATPTVSLATEPPRARSWLVRQLVILFCVAAFSLPAYFIASRFVVTAVVIQGRSMTP